MIKAEEVYKIGKLGKPHGLKGEINFLFDDDVFDRTDADYLVLEVDGILVPFFMEEYRFHGNETVLMKFCDIDTVEQARELTGCNVFFPRHLADAESDDVSWAQLAGFTLIDAGSEKPMGTIRSVDDSTLNILFEVETTDGKTLLIPASEHLITDINTEQHTITTVVPEGLIAALNDK